MKSEYGCGIGPEIPHSHLLEVLFMMFFAIVWLLDVFIFQFHLPHGILLWDLLRYSGFFCLLVFSIIIIKKSWVVVTPEVYKSGDLVKEGIYGYVRHPMYLGILLIYFSFVILNLSFTLFLAWGIIFLFMNLMATYEEKKLIDLFGEEYKQYKEKVSKWIPLK
ncbi:MAG: methyltransferase family protein [archaeon]